MKITYDNKSKAYHITLEYPETEIYIGTDDIVEARTMFVERMQELFNQTIRDNLKDSF